MACLFDHNWSWPRKRSGKDIQVCLDCGTERESKVRFDGPRYRRTQDGIAKPALQLQLQPEPAQAELPGYSSAAA